MVRGLAYLLIFGKPLIMYLGIMTLSSLLFTALVGYTHYIGKPILPFKWHPRLAIFTITLALIHGLLGILSYL